MSKFSVASRVLVLSLAFFAMSCAGPIFFKPPTAATPVVAAAAVPAVTPPPAAPWTGIGVVAVIGVSLFVMLTIANFEIRTKPPQTF